ncbi:hypothetical protein GIB67_024812 [Kingdonia uniflora]|uniref:Helitron helicase-like domain-containing protein n=1 Tax=Kingdonia uniflora TaxID=39325 RepID=A0A7J7NYM0_9MAGN|nr:hypothetical protein GIB67_024812 [Kingdonia uniflora]
MLFQRGRRERERDRQLRELVNPQQTVQQQLSKQSAAQRTRREREKQLREVTTVPQLFKQGLTNHSLASTSRNLAEEFNIVGLRSETTLLKVLSYTVSSQPPYIIPEESSTLLPDSVTILEEQHCTMRSPNIPYPIMHTTSNFRSSTFEIGESLSARANVVCHNVEAVYYNPIESDDERNNDDEGNINGNDEDVQLGRHFLGQMDVVCMHCSTLHWKDEQLSNSSIINPLFGQCCLQGKIKVSILNALPNEFQELYDGCDDLPNAGQIHPSVLSSVRVYKGRPGLGRDNGNGPYLRSFRRYMREYNATNAFTSLEVHIDDQVAHGRGPSSFVIHGELHHRIGALVPNEEQEASYAQLYIYNPGASLNTRHKRNPRLNKDVLKVIQDTLV